MISKVIIILLVLCYGPLFSQKGPVVISEKKTGKRIVLLAKNQTSDTLNVFFMVYSEGYRRSADKPVVTAIPPRTKVPMITLIELSNVPSKYTYELIVKDKNKPEIAYEDEMVDIQNAVQGKLVIFTLARCQKCNALTSALTSNRTSHIVFDITREPALYRQFMKFVEDELNEQTRIQFPVIWNKDHTIFGYDDLTMVMNELQQ
jgi:glutaredoxin